MKYRAGYKYQLADAIEFDDININPTALIKTKYITLTTDGVLRVKAGYAWDGPSGPTYDSKNSMRASLAHDALYQLMRMEKLEPGCRTDADVLLDRILEEDGMWSARRWYWLKGVEWFAGGAIKPENVKVIYEAP